ncbi:MAG: PAQR family membrane homeostasis protein TrhA [Candidatus Heimdallarchaeaceae archaeon]
MKKERFAAYSHLTGALLAVIGSFILIFQTIKLESHRFLGALYSFCIIFLFIASTLYHSLKKKENEFSFWRVLDHIAIFFMIAGTYTPLCYIYLDGVWRWSIIGAQWFLAAIGLVLKPFILNLYRWIETVIYLLMGWMAVIPLKEFFPVMPIEVMFLVITGGLAFTVGAIFHIVNKNPIPNIFSFHDVFHIFIIIGGALHYVAVYIAIVGLM